LSVGQVLALARSTLTDFSLRTAQRLQAHTQGSPLYVRALLAEVPADRWRDWQPVLPAPRAFAASVERRLECCEQETRRLVEAAAVLGARATLATTAAIAR